MVVKITVPNMFRLSNARSGPVRPQNRRDGSSSIDMHAYQVAAEGIVIGDRLRGYRGPSTGILGVWNAESTELQDPSVESTTQLVESATQLME